MPTEIIPEPIVTSRTGGFRIDRSASVLEITRDTQARDEVNHRSLRRAVQWLTYILLGFLVIANLYARLSRGSWMIPIILLSFGLVFFFRSMAVLNNLRCTHETLEVIRIRRGKKIERRTFARDKVGPIRYAVFSSGRYGSVCGLLFAVEDQELKVLANLQIVEAQQILNELERLNYSVVRDVAMPMAVEIEQDRRKSALSIFR